MKRLGDPAVLPCFPPRHDRSAEPRTSQAANLAGAILKFSKLHSPSPLLKKERSLFNTLGNAVLTLVGDLVGLGENLGGIEDDFA